MIINGSSLVQVCNDQLTECVYVGIDQLPVGILPYLSTEDAVKISISAGALWALVWVWKNLPH